MLRLPSIPQDEQAAAIVKEFINNRLIRMMEDIILDEVAFSMAFSGGIPEDLGKKPMDEVIDIDELMQNMEFAKNVSLSYLPENYPIEKANREFLGLYKLLKAKNEYVPELPMEYVLYSVIQNAIWQVDMINQDTEDGLFDELMDDPFFEGIEDEEYTTIELIPEPERSIVLKGLEREAEEDFGPEDLILHYEDLREYKETCFWDVDFALLDDIDEDSLIHSDLAKILGIGERQDVRQVEFSVAGGNTKVKMEINDAPWDSEE